MKTKAKSEPSKNPSTTGTSHCNFCRKNGSDVKKLIAGPNVYICDECVNVCVDIMCEDESRAMVPARVLKIALQQLNELDTVLSGTIGKLRDQITNQQALTEEPKSRHEVVRDFQHQFRELSKAVKALPAGTARTLALTKLEEALLWTDHATEPPC